MLGRITAFTDRDASNNVKAGYTNLYDLAGNVRRTTSVFPDVANPQFAAKTSDLWFAYDSMNRMTIANGTLSGSTIVRGNNGVAITYDAAGRRRTATQQVGLQGWGEIWVPDQSTGGGGHTLPDPNDPEPDGDWVSALVGYMGDRREEYEYRADGYLMNTRFADEGSNYLGNGYVERNGVIAAPVLRATNARDAMGRVSFYQEYDPDGTTIVFNRTAIAYNGASQVTSESQYQRRIEGLTPHFYETTTTNSYGGPGGALSTSSSVNKRDGSDSAAPDTSTTYSYAIWDDARISGTSYNNGQGATHTSTYYYDGLGRLASVQIADGRARTVSFASNPNGQVLSRIEKSAATKNPQDFYYFVDGAQVGELSSNGGYDPARMNYSDSFVTRNWKWSANTTASQPFRWDNSNGTTRAQFGGSGYDPIAPTAQGLQGTDGRYSVREGDTLAGIAASVWGDASLWYLIAEANGLSGSESLPAGTSLIVPDKVVNVHNSSKTFDVYDPNHAAGDLSPTEAKPPKKANKCGALGAILLIAVAIAVTAIVAPWATGIIAGQALAGSAAAVGGAIVGGAIGAAAGSIASQGLGVLTGLQDKFSWKGVAMAAIGGAVGAGIGQIGMSGIGSTFVANAIRGAAGSALTQGIGVAVGLQKKFNFAMVAAAGVGAAIGGAIGGKLGAVPILEDNSLFNHVFNSVGGAANSIANAATRSLIEGSDFGDNLIAALPDVLGSTIGNMLAYGVSGASMGGLRADRVAAMGLRRAVAGDAPHTREQRALERRLVRDMGASRANPGDRGNQTRLEASVRNLIAASDTTPESHARVEDFMNSVFPGRQNVATGVDGPDPITVTGNSNDVDYWTAKTIDRSGIWLGEKKAQIEGRAQEFLGEHPGLGVAVSVANVGLTIAGGPVRAVAGYAYENVKETISGWVADGYEKVGWDEAKSAHGGSGITLAGSLILSGFGGITAAVRGAPMHSLRNALQSFRTRTFQAGPNTFHLDRRSMTHILERHHPDFWNGKSKETQTFFDRSLTPDDIADIAMEGLRQNRDHLAGMRTSTDYVQRPFTYNGQEYIIGLSGGRVGQLYPSPGR